MRVLITGASGVLGSAIYAAFKAGGHEVLGLGFSNATGDLQKVNLLDEEKVEDLVSQWHPDWLIHCAAERRPDVVDKDPERARKLNVMVPEYVGRLASKYSFMVVYISTDYVFDGKSPPYSPSAQPNPLQLYGRTKYEGELALDRTAPTQSIILRVPVLYGPAPRNADSAVNVLLDVVQDQSGKTYKMDHYATRYPTNVHDIANFLTRLAASGRRLPRVIHYSSDEPFTKYEMCLFFARILGLPHSHITSDAGPPSDSAATARPQDCHLDCTETEALRIEGGLGLSGFEEWWTDHLLGSNT